MQLFGTAFAGVHEQGKRIQKRPYRRFVTHRCERRTGDGGDTRGRQYPADIGHPGAITHHNR